MIFLLIKAKAFEQFAGHSTVQEDQPCHFQNVVKVFNDGFKVALTNEDGLQIIFNYIRLMYMMGDCSFFLEFLTCLSAKAEKLLRKHLQSVFESC